MICDTRTDLQTKEAVSHQQALQSALNLTRVSKKTNLKECTSQVLNKSQYLNNLNIGYVKNKQTITKQLLHLQFDLQKHLNTKCSAMSQNYWKVES